MDARFLYFGVPWENVVPTSFTTSQPLFAHDVTNTVPQDVTTGRGCNGKNQLGAEWAAGWQAEPPYEAASNHLYVSDSAYELHDLAPLHPRHERHGDVGVGNGMLSAASTTTLFPSPPSGIYHPSPAGSAAYPFFHDGRPVYPGNSNGEYASHAETGSRMAMPNGRLAQNLYANHEDRPAPSAKALGKRREILIEPSEVPAPYHSFDNQLASQGETVQHLLPYPVDAGSGSVSEKKRERVEDENSEDCGPVVKKSKHLPGPSSAKNKKPNNTSNTRRAGHCPYCGIHISRIHRLRDHFGKGRDKICEPLYRNGKGDVRYSLDRLTKKEIDDARDSGRLFYDSNVQPPLVGPGEAHRLRREEKQLMKTKPLPNDYQDISPLSIELQISPSLGSYVENVDRDAIDQGGPSNTRSRATTQPGVGFGYLSPQEYNNATGVCDNYSTFDQYLHPWEQHLPHVDEPAGFSLSPNQLEAQVAAALHTLNATSVEHGAAYGYPLLNPLASGTDGSLPDGLAADTSESSQINPELIRPALPDIVGSQELENFVFNFRCTPDSEALLDLDPASDPQKYIEAVLPIIDEFIRQSCQPLTEQLHDNVEGAGAGAGAEAVGAESAITLPPADTPTGDVLVDYSAEFDRIFGVLN
ncbi:hypothetical protein FPV67DRAFT_177571 [Lyophyllum atratum]|nr:hypothetical protein FPV67DRAFT_177571 [Lyophyllum atratum]